MNSFYLQSKVIGKVVVFKIDGVHDKETFEIAIEAVPVEKGYMLILQSAVYVNRVDHRYNISPQLMLKVGSEVQKELNILTK